MKNQRNTVSSAESQGSSCPIHRRVVWKSALILYLAMSLGFAAISSNSAFSQTPEPRLTVGNVNFSPTTDGIYNVSVNLGLQRPNNSQIGFGIYIQHVKTLDDVYEKLRPAVDDLADELKHAKIEIPPR